MECAIIARTISKQYVKKRNPIIVKNIESKIQQACVKWFRLQYPNLLLIAIPNGGNRNHITGAILKAEGVMAGAPDLFLFYPSGGYSGLAIEMKTPKGKQTASQKEWQRLSEEFGYKYIVVRSFDQFRTEIIEYIHSTQTK